MADDKTIIKVAAAVGGFYLAMYPITDLALMIYNWLF
jgi:hypothetical protein